MWTGLPENDVMGDLTSLLKYGRKEELCESAVVIWPGKWPAVGFGARKSLITR